MFNSICKSFLLNQCGQFVWWRKSEYPGKSPYRRSVTYILDHTEVVSSTPATPYAEVELPRTIVVIGTDFICGCKCKYPGAAHLARPLPPLKLETRGSQEPV